MQTGLSQQGFALLFVQHNRIRKFIIIWGYHQLGWRCRKQALSGARILGGGFHGFHTVTNPLHRGNACLNKLIADILIQIFGNRATDGGRDIISPGCPNKCHGIIIIIDAAFIQPRCRIILNKNSHIRVGFYHCVKNRLGFFGHAPYWGRIIQRVGYRCGMRQ